MRQRRLLSYEYITPKNVFQGYTQCQEFDFLIGPKDTVTPVCLVLNDFSIIRHLKCLKHRPYQQSYKLKRYKIKKRHSSDAVYVQNIPHFIVRHSKRQNIMKNPTF